MNIVFITGGLLN